MSVIIYILVVVIFLAAILGHMRTKGVLKGDNYGNKSTVSTGRAPEEEK